MSPLKLSALALIACFAASSAWPQEPPTQPTAPVVAQGATTATPTITLDLETLRKLVKTGEAPEFWKTVTFWQIFAAFLGFAVATGLKYFFDIRRDDRNRKIEKETLVAELLGEIRISHREVVLSLEYSIRLSKLVIENSNLEPDHEHFEMCKPTSTPIYDNAIGNLGLLGPDGADNAISYAGEFRLTRRSIELRITTLKRYTEAGGRDYADLSCWLAMLNFGLAYREARLASSINQKPILPLLPLEIDQFGELYSGLALRSLERYLNRLRMYKENLGTEVYDPFIEAITGYITSQQT